MEKSEVKRELPKVSVLLIPGEMARHAIDGKEVRLGNASLNMNFETGESMLNVSMLCDAAIYFNAEKYEETLCNSEKTEAKLKSEIKKTKEDAKQRVDNAEKMCDAINKKLEYYTWRTCDNKNLPKDGEWIEIIYENIDGAGMKEYDVIRQLFNNSNTTEFAFFSGNAISWRYAMPYPYVITHIY